MQPPEMGSVVAVPQVGGCTTATNDGCLKSPNPPRYAPPLPGPLKFVSERCSPCTRVHRRISFTRLRLGRKLLALAVLLAE
jgi:hypothetical protein